MKERESYGYEEDLPDTPLSPLDKDILNLFTTSETDLATDPAGRELQEVLYTYMLTPPFHNIYYISFHRLLSLSSLPLQRS